MRPNLLPKLSRARTLTLILFGCAAIAGFSGCDSEVVNRCEDAWPTVSDTTASSSHALKCSALEDRSALEAWAGDLSLGTANEFQNEVVSDVALSGELPPGVALRIDSGWRILTHSELAPLQSWVEEELSDTPIAYQYAPVLDASEVNRTETVNLSPGERKALHPPIIDAKFSYWKAIPLEEKRIDIGEHVENVTVRIERDEKRPMMILGLSEAGADKLLELTRHNVGKRMAILHDGDRLVGLPIINQAISGGAFRLIFPFGAIATPRAQGAPIIKLGQPDD